MKVKTRKKSKLEKDIQNEILEWLNKKGYFFWRNNSVGLFDPFSGRFRKKSKYQVLGGSDILGIINGRFIAIEVKNKKGKATFYQQEFIDRINEEGGIAFIARSIEDVEKNLFLL